MARIFVGIGSNVDSANNIVKAVAALQQQFPDLRCSRVFESEAVGFVGDNFYNLVAEFSSPLTVVAISECLKQIELSLGRTIDAKKFSPRTVDIDLLLFDHLVTDTPVVLPRAEILFNAFVLWPLSELAPLLTHPVDGRSYAELWQSYDGSQQLWPIDLVLQK
ncbi:2-amino-4-hydroxy-6-hydroxymethyldihydropteridine diphosphokinase [Corallincola holothuriorum]|uniref:2-amino-4-hydroxy-6-hydroxymethyldihydropteridine diphosphokinase n=1 Tax=Corallincola holothuriorum TaxID=2282215 RepID=A0A368NNI2_9GAMM|nr:2-amino-4-hydroxy-6-hydroxymethyldihydropteridine diphosphokinase [Corallincola holothuriorum]RCU51726.1 2-amino-4-hydroxy-6-hydroxymethyldihydropteridine diphosphokinase [Corallincola holothuriorum]